MLKQEEITALLNGLPLGMSYKKALSNKPVSLNRSTSLALGETERRLVRVLSTVVDAINNKLFVKSITVDDTQLQIALEQWKQSIQWDLIERELYRYAIRDGRSYALLSWKNNAPKVNVLEVYDGVEGAYIIYDDEAPVLAVNTWYSGKDRYLDVYYSDKIEKYLLENGSDEWSKRKDSKSEKWPVDNTDINNVALGIPMIEYTIGESDLSDGAVQIQHDINSVIMDQLAIDRTMGYPLRYMKGKVNPALVRNGTGQPLIDPITSRPITRSVELPPGSLYTLDQDAELGQLASAEPNATVFDMLLKLLTLVTKVPTHYFTGEWPSGVALINSEMRLNHLVEDHQAYLSPAVVATVRMMVTLSNAFGGTAYSAGVVDISWESPQVLTYDLRMELDKAQTLTITQQVQAGVRSIDSAVRILNPSWSESEVQAEVARLTASTL